MKLMKYLLPFALATCGFAATLSANDDDGYSTTLEERERDMDAIKDFINAKRTMAPGEKMGHLTISGDVRSDWYHIHTKTRNKKQRGHGSANLQPPKRPHAPYATNEFDVEVNLRMDYKADRTWATAQLQLVNPMGITRMDYKMPKDERTKSKRNTLWGSGVLDNIVLRKAFMGYNAYEEGSTRFDIEVGRRRLYDVFDSKIEFKSYFDGVLLRFLTGWEGMTDFSLKLAAFVVDYTVNHFGQVGEVGFLNIADWGIDFKYSLINWHKQGVNRFDKKMKHSRGARFLNSQFLLAYNFSGMEYCPKSQVYAAYLHNHEARETHFTHHKKANNAWYVGAKVGDVKKQNDWAVDARYEWVQAQAIPENDVSGIGRDNPRKISYGMKRWGGFANYKGWILDGFYAVTDNLTLNATLSRTHQCEHSIGGRYRSWTFELEAIYAF